MNASAALPKVLEKIDADLDKSLERLFAFLRLQSVSTDPAFAGAMPGGGEIRRRRSRQASASTRRCARPPAIRWWSENPATAPARACCSTAITTCSRSIRSNLWTDAALRAAHRGIAGRPQDHRRARRLRRQRPADDLRRGAARLQGGDGQAAAAGHGDDRGRGGMRLEEPVPVRARQCRRVQSRHGARLRHRHVECRARRRSPPRCAASSTKR